MSRQNRGHGRFHWEVGGGLLLVVLLAVVLMQTAVAAAQPIENADQTQADQSPSIDHRSAITRTINIRSFPATTSINRVTLDHFVYLPLISRPPAPPLPPPTRAAFFMQPQVKTGSASIAVDEYGGLHLAYADYLPFADHPAAVYLYCAPGANCADGGSWNGVALADYVNEVQLALTRSGQPRLLIRARSQTAGLDWDYVYAECNQTCTDPGQWFGDWIAGSFGTSIFDISDDTSPQRSFALDRQDRPRFVYQDRNYPIEPDHIGAYYMACEADCALGANWTETPITQRTEFEYEVVQYPALAFTAAGQPRIAAMIDPLGGDTAFYYVACDSNCGDVNQWQRVKLFDRDSGVKVSWDIEVDKNDRPRIAFFKGATLDTTGDRLYYAACNSNCLNEAAWQKLNLGLASGMGKHPDLEFTPQDQPRIAYIRNQGDGLGYLSCNGGCEGSAGSWLNTTIETATTLDLEYPVARPPHCNAGLWSSLTPVLAIDTGGHPRVAYDAVYDTQCLYDDPNDGLPPYLVWHQLWHSVRGVIFPQP